MDNQLSALTTVLAVYGSVLATLGFGLSLWLGIQEISRHKPRLRIVPGQGRLIDGNGRNSESMVLIKAINIGGGSLTITGVGWLLEDKHRVQIIRPYMIQLPAELRERKTLTFYFASRWLSQLKEVDRIVGAFFRDETENMWTCRVSRRTLRRWRTAEPDGWFLEWDESLQTYFRRDGPNGPRIPIPG